MRLLTLALAALLGSPFAAIGAPAVSLYAAGSLTGALGEAAKSYAQSSGVEVATRFGPSGQMRERIEAGEPATLFASADFGHPAKLFTEGKADPPVIFVRNRLCLLARPGVTVEPTDPLAAMLDPALKLGTSTPGNDPSGDYAWALFAKGEAVRPGAQAALEGKALMPVGGKTTTLAPEGRNTVAWHMSEDRADLFLSYCTSGRTAAAELPGLQVLPLPDELAVGADYGLAVLSGPAEQQAAAARFAMFILSPAGQAIMAKWGFLPVTAPAG
ncbi:MAG: molybdate ABC transporter substrate-binding protein [Geminicoccaceae bacterium]